jgi:F-type H+-transporting ATPase subunit delta
VPERTDLVLGLLEGAAEPARNVVRLLVLRNRTGLAADVAEEFRALAEASTGVVRAVVSAALPLDHDAGSRIENSLSGRLGRPVRVEVRHDPGIIGGLVIRIGDRVIDDSIRTHLQQLQAAMV